MTPREPRSAATVILLRPGAAGGVEVFLTRRPEGMSFLGGAYVFPGGTVHKEDASEAVLKRCRGVAPNQARDLLGAHLKPEAALGHWAASIRELFEEVGVLMCAGKDGASWAPRDLEAMRRKIVRKEMSFRALLESEDLFLDAGRLLYFSHWLTPEEFSTRFDTRFFVAALPQEQIPLQRSEEVADSLWIAPERALQLYAKGALPMILPTYASLRTLADFDSVEGVMAEYESKPAA